MPRLLYDLQTTALLPYPRQDDEPVQGLDRSRYRVLLVQQLEQPADYDPATQTITPIESRTWDSPAPGVDGTLTRSWRVETIPPPPPSEIGADWSGFAGWLFQFTPMSEAMERARASRDPQGEPATTALPAAMDEARLRENCIPFALSWGTFLAASGLPAEAVAAIVAKAHASNLPTDFINALQPRLPA